MSKFALIKIEAVKGKLSFFKLQKDGNCKFNDFENEARQNYNSEINSIYHRLNVLASGRRLPEKQFRILNSNDTNVTECEIKTKHLRVYYFIDKENGNIIITGGYKTNQKKDLNHFRNTIKQYLEYRRNENDKG